MHAEELIKEFAKQHIDIRMGLIDSKSPSPTPNEPSSSMSDNVFTYNLSPKPIDISPPLTALVNKPATPNSSSIPSTQTPFLLPPPSPHFTVAANQPPTHANSPPLKDGVTLIPRTIPCSQLPRHELTKLNIIGRAVFSHHQQHEVLPLAL